MSFDHYAEANSIIKLLQHEGLTSYADKLTNAMEEGSTGTEIFMALRFYIKELLDNEKLSAFLKAKTKRLYGELDKSLN